jgi:hypothetical protein
VNIAHDRSTIPHQQRVDRNLLDPVTFDHQPAQLKQDPFQVIQFNPLIEFRGAYLIDYLASGP